MLGVHCGCSAVQPESEPQLSLHSSRLAAASEPPFHRLPRSIQGVLFPPSCPLVLTFITHQPAIPSSLSSAETGPALGSAVGTRLFPRAGKPCAPSVVWGRGV